MLVTLLVVNLVEHSFQNKYPYYLMPVMIGIDR